MFPKLLKTAPIVVATMAVGIWAFGWGSTPASAQGGCGGHGGHAGQGAASAGRQHGASDAAHAGHTQVCPVTGAALDSMGGPVKVLVGGQPLCLCSKGCLGKVQSAPEAYLARAAVQTSQVQ